MAGQVHIRKAEKHYCFSLLCQSYLKTLCPSIFIGLWVGNSKKKFRNYQEKYQEKKEPGRPSTHFGKYFYWPNRLSPNEQHVPQKVGCGCT